MVKRSPEDLGGRLYRASLNPVKIPHDLGKPERDLFKTIINSLPPDWFGAGSLPLLKRYVRSVVFVERLNNQLDLVPIDSPEAANLWKQIVAGNQSLATLSSKLRLSVQSTVSPWSTGRLAERGSGPLDHLLGGREGRNGAAGFPNRQ